VCQGSRLWPGGRFALLGTTIAPGFDVQDYEGGAREWLIERYPAVTDLIRTLTHC
jgi:predicted cupin superfamily sugar epimerase